MNDTFLKACRGEDVDFTPVWLMRQAGPFLSSYKKVLAKYDFLTVCRTPELASKITIQPVDDLGVDAAIIYSDITTTVVPMGMDLSYVPGKGPSYANPIRTKEDAVRLIVPEDVEDGLGFVFDAQKICARELAKKVPLIGFAGSPFTVSAYMIEGGASHSHVNTRQMIFGDTTTFNILMDKVTRQTINYLRKQAEAGAQALMLFDSNAGMLGPQDYRVFNLPYVKRILADLKDIEVPLIYFGLGQHETLDDIAECGADVIGIDSGKDLGNAVDELGLNVSVQGNIEPYVFFQSKNYIEERVAYTLESGRKARGHIFNLGHGVPAHAPEGHVKALVDAVHEQSIQSTSK